ncbi:hypothetical protein MGN70_002343 [Eutypa lata]|nr:hypothetical protein MGN70_002343 [Eutypa lata]
MRLLNVHTRKLEEFTGVIPSYAILSHTWTSEEVSLQDLTSPDREKKTGRKKGYAKIEGLCAKTILDGYKYAWIDTCCIDKSSSAELSEAINSMYAWYQNSQKCYVYLEGVSARDDHFLQNSSFRKARWFGRGWTLQELLAPLELEFYDEDWKYMFMIDRRARNYVWWAGSKERFRSEQHMRLLSQITKISEGVLRCGNISDTCIAARLAWAANRMTTRVEDTAYCLLGLLEVNMPLLYGEGNRAFLRLQQAIISVQNDNSLLAWGYDLLSSTNRIYSNRSVLALSPAAFSQCRDFKALPEHYTRELMGSSGPFPSTMTNVGLQIVLPIISIDLANRVALAILDYTPDEDHLVVVPLVYTGPLGKGHFHRALGSFPFLVDISRYCNTKMSNIRSSLLRRKPQMMHILLQGYRFAEGGIVPLYRRSFSNIAVQRKPYIIDFEDIITITGCELVSFYPPCIGSIQTDSWWRVRVDKDVGWCFLIFRREEYAFGVSIRYSLLKASGGLTASFGEVNLATTIEHLITKSGQRTTVAFPNFESPSFELAVPGKPDIKHVLSLQVDRVFKDWFHITYRAEYR